MTDDKFHEAAKARAIEFQRGQPRELLEEASLLPHKVARMNAKPMIRINPILDLADRFSKAVQPYVACQRGCSHC